MAAIPQKTKGNKRSPPGRVLISAGQGAEATGVAESTWWEWARTIPDFPKPIRISARWTPKSAKKLKLRDKKVQPVAHGKTKRETRNMPQMICPHPLQPVAPDPEKQWRSEQGRAHAKAVNLAFEVQNAALSGKRVARVMRTALRQRRLRR